MFNFCKWFYSLNEGVYYYPKDGLKKYPFWNNIYKSNQIIQLDTEKRQQLWENIKNKLLERQENINDPKQIINCIRHDFTNYETQNKLKLSSMLNCKKIEELILIVKEIYLLVKTIIEYVIPHNLKLSCNIVNFEYLQQHIKYFEDLNNSKKLNCSANLFIIKL